MTINQKFTKTYFILLGIAVLLIAIPGYGQTNIINNKNPGQNYVVDHLHIDLPKKERVIDQTGGAHRFAVPVNTNYSLRLFADPDKNTKWKRYLITISATDAKAINFTMKGLSEAGAKAVYVKQFHNNQVTGPVSPDKNEFDLTAFPIFHTDSIMLEVIVPHHAPKNSITIYRVGLTFNEKLLGVSGECNIDINCPEGYAWQEVKQSVMRIYFDNQYLCTGTLINTTENNKKPYVLTANHCIGNQQSAANSIYYFNYESPECDGPREDYPNPATYTLNGAKLKATKSDAEGRLDFSLLLLDDEIPETFNAYFVGWSAGSAAPDYSVGIHHPGGDVKKICIEEDLVTTANFNPNYDDNSFWYIYKWDAGVTEPGSSGSGLFNRNKQLVGTLTGGNASCDTPYHDFYAKFNLAYDKYRDSSAQLKYWLDPENLGIKTWYGWPADTTEISEEYSFYPNPVRNKLFIYSQALDEKISVKIYNMRGKITWRRQYQDPDRIIIVDYPPNLQGLHIVEIETAKRRLRRKVIFNQSK